MKSPLRSEEELLRVISRELPSPSKDVLNGIGDDCAVIRGSGKADLFGLFKTDAVVEGVHFSPDAPLQLVGWKALCRPLSDIAAMGGKPVHSLVTVAAPREWNEAQWRTLYRGISRAARAFSLSRRRRGNSPLSRPPLHLGITYRGSFQKTPSPSFRRQ